MSEKPIVESGMSERAKMRLSWLFVALVFVSAATLFLGGMPAGASDDHDRVRDYRRQGDIVPLVQLLNDSSLAGAKVIEAELDEEHGQLVYELEVLADDGRVYKRYYDARNGELLKEKRDD